LPSHHGFFGNTASAAPEARSCEGTEGRQTAISGHENDFAPQFPRATVPVFR